MSAEAKDNTRTKAGYKKKKRVHSSQTSPVQPLVGVYGMHFSVQEEHLTTLYDCCAESGRGCFLLGNEKRLHFACKESVLEL